MWCNATLRDRSIGEHAGWGTRDNGAYRRMHMGPNTFSQSGTICQLCFHILLEYKWLILWQVLWYRRLGKTCIKFDIRTGIRKQFQSNITSPFSFMIYWLLQMIQKFSHVTIIYWALFTSHKGDGQNNGNTGYYRNNTICVGCTDRTSVASIFRYLLFA